MVFGKQFRDDQFTWLMQWAIVGSRKLKKTRLSLTLLKQEALRALVHLGRLGLEGLLISVYPKFII